MELTEKQTAALRTSAEHVIVAIEEEARLRLLDPAADPMTSQEKRDQAIIRILEKHPKLGEADALEIIDALLPKVRQLIPATRVPVPVPVAPAGRRM